MNVVVCFKQTPDTADLPGIDAAQAESGKFGLPMVINPWDEFALEEGVRLNERFGADVTAITLGDETATDALRRALAMGVNNAVRLADEAFQTADAWATARVLAAAVQKHGQVDIVLTGKQTVDGNSGLVSVGLARQLGFRYLSNVTSIEDISNGQIRVKRRVEEGIETVTAQLPAVVSVAREINEPRYPSFLGIRKAGKIEIPTWTRAELGLDANNAGAVMTWRNFRKPVARDRACEFIAGNDAAQQAAALLDRLLAEKVL